MARNLNVGEDVYVPLAKLGASLNRASALFKTTVAAKSKRSIRVLDPSGNPVRIAAAHVHRRVGVAIVRIGDFATELALLDPLAKTLLHFCRLVLSEDEVRLVQLRSLGELVSFWGANHGAYAMVVLIGHGTPSALRFAVGGEVDGETLAATFAEPDGVEPKVIVSLACETGRATFAQRFSRSNGCECFVAPYHTIHGATASQFFQALLVRHLLDGTSVRIAYKRARETLLGTASFRFWRAGALST